MLTTLILTGGMAHGTLTAAKAQIAFTNVQNPGYPGKTLGSNPWYIAAADLNGDGKKDLIAGFSNTPGNVQILLGNGDGTVTATPLDAMFTNLSQPRAVAVGDFNGDGKADLVVASFGAGQALVYFGNGDGTFQSPAYYITGVNPNSIVVTDLNGDGKQDFVITNSNSGTVNVFINNGDGTFTGNLSQYPTDVPGIGSPTPFSVTAGDFNGDGKIDIAVVNQGGSSNDVAILLGNGDGTLQAPVTYAVGGQPFAVAAGDVNGDGILDLAVCNANTTGTGNTVSVLIGKGNGTFKPAVNYPTGKRPRFVILDDLDNDGILDLATANNGDGTVSVLSGRGDGTFQPKVDFPVGGAASSGPETITAVDLDGDGRLDLVVSNNAEGSLTILKNTTPTTATASLSGTVRLLDYPAILFPTQPITFQFHPAVGAAFTRTVMLSTTGAYTVSALPKTSYTVGIKGPKWLRVDLTANTTGGNVTGLNATLLGGDANNDNTVDIGDFGILVNAYGSDSTVTSSGYDARADFTGDGTVDIADFGVLVNSYGATGDP